MKIENEHSEADATFDQMLKAVIASIRYSKSASGTVEMVKGHVIVVSLCIAAGLTDEETFDRCCAKRAMGNEEAYNGA